MWKSVKYLNCTHKILKTREYFQNTSHHQIKKNTNTNVVLLYNISAKLLLLSLNIVSGNNFVFYLFYISLALLVHLHMDFGPAWFELMKNSLCK